MGPATGTALGGPLDGHASAVTSVAFGTAPDGRLVLATGSTDRTARVWDPLTGTALGGPLDEHASAVTSVAFGTAPDGRLLLATASTDGARVWDPLTGRLLRGPLIGHADWVRSVAFGTAPDGRLLLATASTDRTARVWDPHRPAPHRARQCGDVGGVRHRAGRAAAPGHRQHRRRAGVGPAHWHPHQRLLTVYTRSTRSVAFGTTPGGRLLLATAGTGSTARVWDPLTGPVSGPSSGTPTW